MSIVPKFVRLAFCLPLLLGLLAACGTPDPTPTPAPPDAPDPTTTPSLEPWEIEWQETIEAARREGPVAVTTFNLPDRQSVEAFADAYPDIGVEAIVLGGRDFVARVPAEMEAGVYNFDVYISGSTTGGTTLTEMGVLDDTRGAFILPELLDDATWVGELDDWWSDDQTKRHQFNHSATIGERTFFVNRNEVTPEMVSSLDDWLNPQLASRICIDDPRSTGGDIFFTEYRLQFGNDAYEELLTSGVIRIIRDGTDRARELIRGGCWIAVGPTLDPFEAEGISLDHLEEILSFPAFVPPPEIAEQLTIVCCGEGKYKGTVDGPLSTGVGGPALIRNAPNPNAAKVFINWFLSREGQEAWLAERDTIEREGVLYTRACSIRTDLIERCDPEIRPVDGNAYISYNYASNFALRGETQDMAEAILGR